MSDNQEPVTENGPEAAVDPPVVVEEKIPNVEPPRHFEGRQVEYPCVPEEPDPPSYAPIITGLGIAVSAWGFLTSPTILALGFFTFVYGMSIWIKELTHHEP